MPALDYHTIVAANIEGLIFDCDGTLVDSMPLHMKAWQAAFNGVQAVYHEDFLRSLNGMKETDVIDHYNRTYGLNLDSRVIVRLKHDFFRQHLSEIKPMEPVVDIVKQFHGKKPLAVVSGSIRDHVQVQLKVIGVFSLFDIILTADDPFKPKPAPDLFIEAARRMKIPAARCLVFEDGEVGLQAAKNAGMPVVDVRDLIKQASI
jgi:HAD superfamily hydrolase (TIGR01509 family)